MKVSLLWAKALFVVMAMTAYQASANQWGEPLTVGQEICVEGYVMVSVIYLFMVCGWLDGGVDVALLIFLPLLLHHHYRTTFALSEVDYLITLTLQPFLPMAPLSIPSSVSLMCRIVSIPPLRFCSKAPTTMALSVVGACRRLPNN